MSLTNEKLTLTITTLFRSDEIELIAKCLIERLIPEQKTNIENLAQKENLQDYEYVAGLIKANKLIIHVNMLTTVEQKTFEQLSEYIN